MVLVMACAARLVAQADDPGPPDQDKSETPPPERPMEHRFWDRLHLTDDQRAKLHQIHEADEEGIRSAWAQVAIAREVLKAALLANPENTADVQTKATNLANALSATAIRMATHRAKVNQVLTPVQRVALLEEGREHRMPHRCERPGRGREERGEWHAREEERWHGRGEERGEAPRPERRHGRVQDQSSEQTPAPPQETPSPATPEASQTPGTPNG